MTTPPAKVKTPIGDLPESTLVALYIKMRELRAARKDAYTLDDDKDKKRMERIEGELLLRFQTQGIDSISVNGVGTAYKTTKTSATVADWDAFFSHVLQNEAWELLEHRANKKAVEQHKIENEELPPGVNWNEITAVNFRKK